MAFGLDFVKAPSIAAMKKVKPQVEFVCRYLSEVNNETKVKLLTLAEAQADSEAGIAIVSNYEWTGTTALGGANAGKYDAGIAAEQHTACGGPADRPIYFSIDWNATQAQMAVIIDYFHGVASVIGLARTGAYGSDRVIKALFDAGAITWGWQTYAWSGGEWDPRAHIHQYQNGVMFDGQEVDFDESVKPDFGQWLIGGEMLQITDPLVGNYFEEQDANHWLCKHNNCVIQYGNLALYRSVKSGQTPDLAGLTLFGLPKGNEVPIDNEGNTEQPYERCKVRYDPKHKYDNPPGAGASYTVHIDTPAPTPTPPVVNPDVVTQLHTIETATSTALKDLDAAS